MANSIAYIVLLGWPLVVIGLFRALSLVTATAISLIAGYLFLPSSPSFNLPLIPPYDKVTATTIPILIMCLILKRDTTTTGRVEETTVQTDTLPGFFPKSPFLLACLVAVILQPIATAFLNQNALIYPNRILKGLTLYDGASKAMLTATALIPFFIARRYFFRAHHHKIMLLVMVCFACLYSFLALYEVRMSPQLNKQIYGYFPHSWIQHLRDGGYRPLVFLGHGLLLGIFLAMSVLAAATMTRICEKGRRWIYIIALALLIIALILSKNFGALLISTALFPVVMLCRPRTQILIAACIATGVLLYPMLRSTGVISSERVISFVSNIASPERLSSLNFRLNNEDMLLEKAGEKPIFGWGHWARNRVYDEKGNDLSTTDGTWIIAFGEAGWIGYLSQFGLMTGPIIILAVRRRKNLDTASAGLCVVLAAHLLNLVPNSGISPITWILAGAVAGRAEWDSMDKPSTKSKQVKLPDTFPKSRYARDFGTAESTNRRAGHNRTRRQNPSRLTSRQS